MKNIEYYQEQRKKLIEQTVENMLAEGGELYPFAPAQFGEAIRNLEDSSVLVLSAYAHTANKLAHNEMAKIMFADALLKLIREYWEPVAEGRAERETVCAEELRDDAKQEHLDMQSELTRDRRMGL